MVRAAAPPSPHTARGTAARACTRAGGGACGAPAPSARRTRARRAHTARAPAPRAADHDIGAEGAKELAAALKANATLTTLNLYSACRGAALPTHTPLHRRAHARMQEGGVRRASPEGTPHARSPRPRRGAPFPRVPQAI